MRKFISSFFIFCTLSVLLTKPIFARTSVPPIPFKTWDNAVGNWASDCPQCGPIGGIVINFWSVVNPKDGVYEWGNIEQSLNKAQSMQTAPLPNGTTIKKPTVLQVDFWEEATPVGGYNYKYSDYTPTWVYQSGGSASECITKVKGLPCNEDPSGEKILTGYVVDLVPQTDPSEKSKTHGVTPRIDDSKWQAAYFKFLRAFAAKYDNDPRVSGFVISMGMGAEAFTKKPKWNVNERSPINGYKYSLFIDSLADVVRSSFKNKTAYLTLGGEEFTGNVFNAATKTQPFLGVKSNALDVDLNQYEWVDGQLRLRWPMALFDGGTAPKTSWAFEDAKLPGSSGLYFMTLWLLSGHADWFDWRDINHFKGIAAILPYFWTNFVPQFLGKDITEVSSVWTALRDTSTIPITWTDSATHKKLSMRGREGNYSYWLYQSDTVTGGKTVPLWNANLPASARSDIYAYYARRTDQATSNPYMYFKLDNNFTPKKQGEEAYKLKLIFLNSGTDSLSIEYKNKTGQAKVVTINKGTSLGSVGHFVEKTIELPDAYFNNQMSSNTDFRLSSNNDGDEIIHLVMVTSKNTVIPTINPSPTSIPTPTLTPTKVPTPTPTRIPTLTPTKTPTPTITPIHTPTPTPTLAPLSLKLSSGWNYLTWKSEWGNRTENELPEKCQFISHYNDYFFNINNRNFSLSKTLSPGQTYFVFCQ